MTKVRVKLSVKGITMKIFIIVYASNSDEIASEAGFRLYVGVISKGGSA